MTSDAELLKPLLENKDLSPLSIKMYANRLKTLMAVFDVPLRDILRKPEYYSRRIRNIYSNQKTLRGFFTVILAIFKYNPEFKLDNSDDYLKWRAEYLQSEAIVEKEVKQNKPSERQLAGYVPFQEFKNKIHDLPKHSTDRLLIAMYSMIPPARNDYHRLRIYRSKIPKDHEPNYILITTRGIRLVLGEYKTSKSMGEVSLDLPKDLQKEITRSLKDHEREWLFMDRDNQPYNANAFIKYVNRVFKRLFGRPLTISILRHSFISNIDFNTTSIAEKEQISKIMGHSVETQDRYRWVSDHLENIALSDEEGNEADD